MEPEQFVEQARNILRAYKAEALTEEQAIVMFTQLSGEATLHIILTGDALYEALEKVRAERGSQA